MGNICSGAPDSHNDMGPNTTTKNMKIMGRNVSKVI